MFKRSKPTPDIPYPNTWLVPQSRTEAILRDCLAQFGVSVEFATELTDFELDVNGVTATLAHQGKTEQVHADYVVGANGGRSFVRKTLGVGFEGKTYVSEHMLVGDVQVDGLSRKYWHVWPRAKGGQVALCPLPGTTSFQFTADFSPNAEAPELTAQGAQEICTHATGRRDIRLHDPSWLSIYQPNVRMVNRYRVGGCSWLKTRRTYIHPKAARG
jgi:2-polyprenyl-6-methoxyphenol hydroxylase-like FAD-dependent oxidoreductase